MGDGRGDGMAGNAPDTAALLARDGMQSADGRRRLVYILGSTRSGTSALRGALTLTRYKGHGEGHMDPLLMRLVDAVRAHRAAAPPGLRNAWAEFDPDALLRHLFAGYETYLAGAFGSDYLVDKTPTLAAIRAAPTLNRLHDAPRFIFCARRHVDNVQSKLKKFPDLGFADCCRDWAACNAAWRESRAALNGNFLELDFHDLSTDPAAVAGRISGYLGLDDPAETALMATYLTERRPQARADRDVTVALKLGEIGWSAAETAMFRDICGPLGAEMGYGEDSYFRIPGTEIRFGAGPERAGGASSVLEAFRLVIDPDRFPDPGMSPDLAPQTGTAALIEAALQHELDKLGLAPDQIRTRPGPRMGCLVRAILALNQAGQHVACAHLAVASGSNRRQIAVTAARAMLEARAPEAAAAYMARIEADPETDLAVRRNFVDLRMKNRLGLTPDDHRIFVPGPVPATLEAAFATMPQPGIEWTGPLMADALVRRHGLSGAAAEDFSRRLDWGRAVQDYLAFLMFYISPEGGVPAGDDRPGNAEIHALAGQIPDLLVLPDPAPMLRAAGQGRSMVLCSAHAGLPVLAPYLIRPTGLPAFGVTAQAETDLDDPHVKTLGLTGHVPSDFLKAVKLLRREPHVIQVMPDGGYGDDPVTMPFLNTQVQLGPGAAVLGWQVRAATFFFSTRWRDGRLHVYLREGPVAEAGGDRVAFESAFYDFYLGCLEKIVMGAPEDMSPGSGFWPALITDEVRAAFRAGRS